jgi:hypothetical protein
MLKYEQDLVEQSKKMKNQQSQTIMNLIQTKLQHNNNFIKTKFSLATPNKLLIIHDIFYILYKNNMLFDFNAFIGELRENSEKKEIIEKYENAL